MLVKGLDGLLVRKKNPETMGKARRISEERGLLTESLRRRVPFSQIDEGSWKTQDGIGRGEFATHGWRATMGDLGLPMLCSVVVV